MLQRTILIKLLKKLPYTHWIICSIFNTNNCRNFIDLSPSDICFQYSTGFSFEVQFWNSSIILASQEYWVIDAYIINTFLRLLQALCSFPRQSFHHQQSLQCALQLILCTSSLVLGPEIWMFGAGVTIWSGNGNKSLTKIDVIITAQYCKTAIILL